MDSADKALCIILPALFLMIVGATWAAAYASTHQQIPCQCQPTTTEKP